MNAILVLLIAFFTTVAWASNVVNVYVWGGEIPKKVIQQFEHQTGIKVNFSTYDSNETLFAKLKASNTSIYDVILPSAYYVERMRKLNMLMPLDPRRLPNLSHVDTKFRHNDYDDGNQFSVPLIWGATGIFFNQQRVAHPPQRWSELWQPQWRNQLMLLDDSREVFAIALMSLGFDPNDRDPNHIAAAYQHLLRLVPNIKLFASDSIQAIMIDEDASLGSAWSGDAFKAHAENGAIAFSYPLDGFVIWLDCLAIPANPPHPAEAYAFINYLLQPEVSVQIALIEGHAITNREAWLKLPAAIRNNPVVYPDATTMSRAHLQHDVGEETLALYNRYWEQLKLAF